MNIASSNVKHTNCYKKYSYIILDEVSAIATSQVKGWLSFFLVPFSCFSPSIVSTTSPMTYGFFTIVTNYLIIPDMNCVLVNARLLIPYT